jgi:hypothetical protein
MTTNNSLWRQIAKNFGVVGSQFTTTNSILKQIARVRGVTNLEQTDNALLRQIARTYSITEGLTTDNAILKLIARNQGYTAGLTTDNSILKLIRGGLHPDTSNYLGRVTTAGGTVTPTNLLAIDVAIKSMHEHGLRGGSNLLKYFLILILTSSFTGCLVPVYDDGVGAPSNTGFVAGNWSPTLGLTGVKSTNRLNTNFSLATSLGTFTLGGRSDFHFSLWQTANIVNSDGCCMGIGPTGFSSTASYTLYAGGAGFDFHYFQHGRNSVSEVKTTSAVGAAHILGNVPSHGSARILRNGSLQGSSSGSPFTLYNPLAAVTLFSRWNYTTSGADFFSNGSANMFTMGAGLTPSQETALYNILNALRIALGA